MAAVIKEEFVVRKMQLADLPIVMEIEQAAYPFPWTMAIFQDCLRVGYNCLILEFNNKISGYAILSTVLQECHLLNICIDPDFQGRGLGKKFLEYILSLVKSLEIKIVQLEVRPSNTIATQLYFNLGFEQIGYRKAYYPAESGREDALVLALVIDNFS